MLLHPPKDPLPAPLAARGRAILGLLSEVSYAGALDLACRSLVSVLLAARPQFEDSTRDQADYNTLCQHVELWVKLELAGREGIDRHGRGSIDSTSCGGHNGPDRQAECDPGARLAPGHPSGREGNKLTRLRARRSPHQPSQSMGGKRMAMRLHVGIRTLGSVGLLLGCLTLVGCPKHPGMDKAASSTPSPSAAGPTAAASGPTSTEPAPQNPEPTEIAVARRPMLEETVVQPAPGRAVSAQAGSEASPLKDVFFGYDTAAVRDDQQAALNDDVRWLKANSGAKVRIEGHCDERGTAEYNLGLGERRAAAVKNYLISAGIPAARISTVSYGKERPFVAGHDETAWQQNRRAHLEIERQ